MLRVLRHLKQKYTDYASSYKQKLAERQPKYDERTKILKQELGRGYFDDFKTLNQYDEDRTQTFSAEDAQLLELSKYDAISLDGRPVDLLTATKKKASLVTVAFRSFSEGSINSWIQAYKSEFHDPSLHNIVQISVVDHWFWAKLRFLLLSSMRKSIAAENHSNHICIFGDETAVRVQNDLKIKNRLQGHVLVVDHEARIRWKSVGPAYPEGIEDMKKVVARLSRKISKENIKTENKQNQQINDQTAQDEKHQS
eukprot:TRINITY_DN4409_c0_g2_i3.p1 TRINITY_DN4409_c0_g2~~TRINITY_DN4409_c0_g2_i3.p1  ORF type:complete len:254 (-),score=49.59 TRINITY_DN4409_c0_g2_i3:1762-2523(-)